MKRNIQFILLFVLFIIPSTAMAYGEGEDIPSMSRAMHLLVNEARSDVQTALSLCEENCTEGVKRYGKQKAPVWWNNDLHKSAMFHSTMMSKMGCLEHESMCKLRKNVSGCDGSPECACEGKTASCDTLVTDTFDRIKKFAKNASSEIIYTGSETNDAFTAFYSYLHEDGNETYGHRESILDSANKSVGFGDVVDDSNEVWDTGDFGSVATSDSPITAGAYYYASSVWSEYARIGDGNLWFKMHYYAKTPVVKTTISLNGQCSTLEFVVGNTTNGTYGIVPTAELDECAEYFYEAVDKNGKITRYPTTGVLLFECEKSWKKSNTTQSCLKQASAPVVKIIKPPTPIIKEQNTSAK